MLGGILFSLLLNAFFAFIIYFLFWPELVYVSNCFFGVLIYSIYLVYNNHWILEFSGKQYKIDDYCFAALYLYLFIDLINLIIFFFDCVGIFFKYDTYIIKKDIEEK